MVPRFTVGRRGLHTTAWKSMVAITTTATIAATTTSSAATRTVAHGRMPRTARRTAAKIKGHNISSVLMHVKVTAIDPEEPGARLKVVNATRITLRNVLDILGIDAPERM